MKAWVLKATGQPLEREERSERRAGPGEVVVELKSAALNRRDYFITRGLYPGIRLPVILGSDGAGKVRQLGAGVDLSWQDREVIINPGMEWGACSGAQGSAFNILGMPRDGTLATEVVVPAVQLHPRPGHLSWEEAAALPLAGVTAYRALFSQGGLRGGETVVITGIGGGVATFALQYAVAVGAKVWVTSSSAQKIQRAVGLGAEGGFDYTDANWGKECAKLAGAPGLIVDGAGGAGYRALIDLVAPGGRIVNYGATAGPPSELDLFKLFWKQLRIQGSTMGAPADFVAMLEMVERHGMKPVVDAVFDLEEANEALERMECSPQFGKTVLRI